MCLRCVLVRETEEGSPLGVCGGIDIAVDTYYKQLAHVTVETTYQDESAGCTLRTARGMVPVQGQQARDPERANVSVRVQMEKKSISCSKAVRQENSLLLGEGSAFLLYSGL